jgi:hypothetical protein
MSQLVLGPRQSPAALLVQGPRKQTAGLVTAFTTAPTGRVFNSRFSDRFKKS